MQANEAIPQKAQAPPAASQSNLPVIVGLSALAVGGVFLAKPKNAGPGTGDGKASGGQSGGGQAGATAKASAEAQEAPKASATGGQAPQSAGMQL